MDDDDDDVVERTGAEVVVGCTETIGKSVLEVVEDEVI